MLGISAISEAPLSTTALSTFTATVGGQFMGVTVTLPSGEVLRYSREGVPVVDGFYEPFVQSLGNVVFHRSDPSGNVVTPTVDFRLADKDNDFTRRVARGERIVGSRVDVDELVNSTRHFSGEVRSLEPDGSAAWSFHCGPRDSALSGDCPATFLTLDDWPNIDKANLNKLAPWCWAVVDSAGTGGQFGAVACLYVDTVRFWYLVSFGWVTVLRMFKDKVAFPEGPTWLTRHVVVNGRRYTIIDFTTNQGATAISCDVLGYMIDTEEEPPVGAGGPPDTEGGGSDGVPLRYVREAGDVFVHAATNLWLNQNKTGIFQNSPSPDVDAAAFTVINEALSGLIPYRVSVFLTAPTTGYAAIAEWCKATGAVVSWDRFGRLTASLPFSMPNADFIATPWLRFDHADLLDLHRAFEARDREAKLTAVYGLVPSDPGTAHSISGNTGEPGAGEVSVASAFAPAFI